MRRHLTTDVPNLLRHFHLSQRRQLCARNIAVAEECSSDSCEPRISELGIPMISAALHRQIFGSQSPVITEQQVEAAKRHLAEHQLLGRPVSSGTEPRLQLPRLNGSLDEHFRHIASEQTAVYRALVHQLISSDLPVAPVKWLRQPGWHRYFADGRCLPVAVPDSNAIVFDVEVLVRRQTVVMATAVSPQAWYGWVSPLICGDISSSPIAGSSASDGEHESADRIGQKLEHMVPLESGERKARLVVGHNVGFDRSWVREQYLLQMSATRFLDTMSMHVSVAGITSGQRALLMKQNKVTSEAAEPAKKKTVKGVSLDWFTQTSLNSLADVYKLYCDGTLQKSTRDLFVKGTAEDIVENFNELMCYCASDTRATWLVFRELWPQFQERFPHPATLAGSLEMGQTYLPVTTNWQKYIRVCEENYQDLGNELSCALRAVADDACRYAHNESYRDDPWLWDLDWSTQHIRLKKPKPKKSKGKSVGQTALVQLPADWKQQPKIMSEVEFASDILTNDDPLDRAFDALWKTQANLYKCQPLLPGYPAWYRILCDGPSGQLVPLSASKRCVPKLLRLTWNGYPLHFDSKHGWGYLIPGRPINDREPDDGFPLEQLEEMVSSTHAELSFPDKHAQSNEDFDHSYFITTERKSRKQSSAEGPPSHMGIAAALDVRVYGCWFFPLPHKDGSGNNVGNPLAQGFLGKVEDGTLSSAGGSSAERVLRITQKLSYWRNNRERICSQRPVFLDEEHLPVSVRCHKEYGAGGRCYGAILPQVRVAGTLTRRSVERTWLTASNARSDRLGSELRAMVEAPAGYRFVGADVDSQELWIASLIGDAAFCRLHGGTAFSWMTLQGDKSHGTDLHSRTAAVIGVTRDNAKVLNYGRIYGGSKPFAVRLLRQYNPSMTSAELTKRVAAMYQATKGVQHWKLNGRGRSLLLRLKNLFTVDDDVEGLDKLLSLSPDLPLAQSTVRLLARVARISSWQDLVSRPVWHGGSESHMFNRLEEIASELTPATPVLGARMSRGLEPAAVGSDYVTSRVNWVVQSSAVDFLHVMLVCMRWLMTRAGIDGRFCISIHDEVRYIVREEHSDQAALALHFTNLLTRCLFAERLGMPDLPQSVAFFSAVDVDRVLRKDVNNDCCTPSNPDGLRSGYGIDAGDAFDIHEIVRRTGGSLSQECGQ